MICSIKALVLMQNLCLCVGGDLPSIRLGPKSICHPISNMNVFDSDGNGHASSRFCLPIGQKSNAHNACARRFTKRANARLPVHAKFPKIYFWNGQGRAQKVWKRACQKCQCPFPSLVFELNIIISRGFGKRIQISNPLFLRWIYFQDIRIIFSAFFIGSIDFWSFHPKNKLCKW